MPQQCTLLARPVILSENKRNVIPHGRPLSPIGTARSTRPFFVPRQAKDSFTEEKHGDTISLKASPSVTSSTSLMDYHKSANENLMTINNNLSLMLKESFAGIDNICQKVRLCLLEANTLKPPENIAKNLGEDLEQSRRENFQTLSTCEEEAESIDGIPDLMEDPEEEDLAEIVEENEEEGNDKENRKEELEERPKRTPSITPFFTILNPKTESVEVSLIKSMSSKLAISRSCTAESFQKTMREVEELADYEELLTSMVEGINREIDECYAQFPKIEGETKRDNDKKGSRDPGKKEEKKNNSKATSSKSRKRRKKSPINEELKKYHEASKIQRDLMEDQFSENDLTYREPCASSRRLALSISRMDFTCPDVYRKRAITDLHKRLEAQVEANDSLIFFQKLMAKNKKFMIDQRPATAGCNSEDKLVDSNPLKSPIHSLLPAKRQPEERRQRSLADLSKKYQDSLWFKQKKHESKRNKKEAPAPKKKRDGRGKKDKKVLPQSYTIGSSPSGGTKTNKISVKSPSQASICNCKIKITNDQPLSDAQRCKLHWMRAKYSQLRHKKLKYLDILDDITKNDLLPLKAEYPRRDDIKYTGVKGSYLYKLLYGQNHAWEQLFRSSTNCSQENFRQCSASTIRHKPDLSGESNESNSTKNTAFSVEQEPHSDLVKGDVIRKLSKYIFPEGVAAPSPKRVFTVMPVHVFYDNSRMSPENRKNADMPNKLPLIPMKETKEYVKKAEWNDATKRAKPVRIVFDPILRKIEREIRQVDAKPENKTGNARLGQTNSWSPKSFARLCSAEPRAPTVKIDTIDKAPQKQRNPTHPNNRAPPIAELFKRSPKPSSEKVQHALFPPAWNNPILDSHRHQKDTEAKQKIQKTASTEAATRKKSEQQRKIWEHKYGKSVGQKLLNFIEKQPVQHQAPVPKYALPKGVVNPTRHQAMLEQLRTLKQKNDSIQMNIQKAIQVIENKMVDILSKPTTSESIEAFDEMEKEITNVLSLMKTPSLPTSVNNKGQIGKFDDYATDLSDELFQRLDKILESPGMSSSGRSSKNSLKKEEHKRRHKVHVDLPAKSSDMTKVCFSSTSATGEEKFTITGISPKRPYKSPSRAPYIRNPMDATLADPDDVSTISNELRKLENELKFKHGAEPEDDESERTSDSMPVLKQNSVPAPAQEQVVNLALLHQSDQEGSAGDQLQELKKLLENELKSMDASDEKTRSIGVSFSQGDYQIQNVVQENADEQPSDSTERDVGSALEEKEEESVQDKTESENVPKSTETKQEEAAEKAPSVPVEIPVKYQEATMVVQGSQQSLDITGPYFTPLTSPLTKTRCQVDEDQLQRCPIVEEDSQCCRREDGDSKQNNPVGHDGDERHGEEANDRAEGDCHEEDQRNQVKDEAALKQDGLDEEKDETRRPSTEEDSTSGTNEKDDFYENVNKIISRVENVYNQLEEFEDEMLQEERKFQSTSLTGKMALFQDDPPETPPAPDVFLTPFMHAVKGLRETVAGEKPQESRNASPRMNSSPSLYNVLSFLDNLADFKQEQAVEVYTPRLCYSAYVVHIPQAFRQFTIHHETSFVRPAEPVPPPPNQEAPKKKYGCLKNPASSTVNTVSSKSKQKVSFLLQKEEKSTQVTSCPFHSVIRILSQQKVDSSTDTTASVKKDEQVSASLDAVQNKSVDKMSLPEDETTYQSTFEFSDEYSSDRNDQMPEQIAQNIQESFEQKGEDTRKNLVEIFRKTNGDDNRPAGIKVFSETDGVYEGRSVPEGIDKGEDDTGEAIPVVLEEASRTAPVKVFYDDFKAGQEKIDLKLICGYYNEDSILQVRNSLGKDVAIKKRESLEKLLKNLNENTLSVDLLQGPSLLEPLNNLNQFVDSNLLKEAVEKRQTIRMLRRKSVQSVTVTDKRDREECENAYASGEGQKENLIKGFYVFVYLLMFTALNLEYKCVQ